jgi:Fe-S-cluster containining protein
MTHPAEPSSPADDDLRQAVDAAADCPQFLAELRELLQRTSQTLPDNQTLCTRCGRCCDFASAGHRLYVTAGELALLAEMALPSPSRPLRCGFQVEGLCTARELRPMGCRLYHCDEALGKQGCRAAEEFHQAIQELHQKYRLPYRYTEMTQAMAVVGSC